MKLFMIKFSIFAKRIYSVVLIFVAANIVAIAYVAANIVAIVYAARSVS